MTNAIERVVGSAAVRVFSDPGFLTRAAGDEGTYDRVHDMSGQYAPSSAYAIECRHAGVSRKCVVLASGGATHVHETSLAVVEDTVFLAVGNRVVALLVPALDVAWKLQADESTCLGVYFHERTRSLIVHGELVVSRVDLAGKVVWTHFGSDAFTGPCLVDADAVTVTDASQARTRLSVDTGRPLDV